MAFTEKDGTTVLIPTVTDDGRVLSNEEAIMLYDGTDKHLGKFKSKEDANAYAEQLHRDQEQQYIPRNATPNQAQGVGTFEQQVERWNYKQIEEAAQGATPNERVAQSFADLPPIAIHNSTKEPIKTAAPNKIMNFLEAAVYNKPWPQKLIETVATDLFNAVRFSGQVLEGKADPAAPENYDQVMNMAFMGLFGTAKSLRSIYPKLDGESVTALEKYAGSAHSDINRFLAGKPIPDYKIPVVEKYIAKLDDMITASPPLVTPTTVYRGIPGGSFVSRFPELSPGDVMKWEAFTSTSRNMHTARMFAGGQDGIIFEIQVPRGTKAVDVNATLSREGRDHVSFEKELLLPRDTHFKIIELDPKKRVIKLEVIDKPGKQDTVISPRQVESVNVPIKEYNTPPSKFSNDFYKELDAAGMTSDKKSLQALWDESLSAVPNYYKTALKDLEAANKEGYRQLKSKKPSTNAEVEAAIQYIANSL